jgi:hypothetical protein
MKQLLVLTARLVLCVLALGFVVNGGYEYMILNHVDKAAFNIALASLIISWYLDSRKEDKDESQLRNPYL